MKGGTTPSATDSGQRRLRCVVFSVLLLAIHSANTAHAQVPGEEIARRAFEEGVALEKKGDFAGALGKFKESEQIKATLGNRFHKAYCLEMTGKLAAAFIEYEIVERTARESNKGDIVEATRSRLEPLRTKVPQLALKLGASAPKETEVALDGTPVAPALLDGKAFRLDPGEHVVTAHAPAHESFTKTVTTAESTTTSVEIVLPAVTLKPSAGSGTSLASSSDAKNTSADTSRSLTLPILTTAGAVVLAVGGVGAYVVAGAEQDELEEKTCPSKRSCEEDKGPTRTFDALALGAFVGAAGLAALSIVLWTSKPSSSASSASRVVARSSWLGLEGRF